MLTSSNGIKIGVIGLGEREWYAITCVISSLVLSNQSGIYRLATINSLPPNLIYKSASETAKELVPGLREQGAELIVAVTHQREPNDNKLAEKVPPGLIDIILGGHDHFYGHSIINSTHVLRSGTDFKQLSYIEAWRKPDGPGWDFSIARRDVVRALPQHGGTIELVGKLTSTLNSKLQKPIGYTATPLDARFSTVRTQESNMGNFVCDLMRYYYNADCSMMAAGTIRGDQIYTPGILRVKDILHCFPFEDPVVVLKLSGKAIRDALENGVGELPAMEGRFPQVSNIKFCFSGSKPRGSRIEWAKIGDDDIEDDKLYVMATRGYMARGKDGFESLLVKSEGGDVEEIISEEDGLLISTILRQYFLSLKVLGKWQRLSQSLSRHWSTVHNKLPYQQYRQSSSITSPKVAEPTSPGGSGFNYVSYKKMKGATTPGIVEKKAILQSLTQQDESGSDLDSESDSDSEVLSRPRNYITLKAISPEDADRREFISRRVLRKWRERVGVSASKVKTIDDATTTDSLPPWTRVIAPVVDGRITRID